MSLTEADLDPGESGYGYYHGRYGLDAFSHARTIVAPPLWLDRLMSFRYPPYDVRHKSKIEVRNKLGFRRGEGLEDQRLRKLHSKRLWMRICLVLVVIAYFIETRYVSGPSYLASLVRRLRAIKVF